MLELSGIPHAKLRPLIEDVRSRLKSDPVVQRMFEEYGVDISELDLVPIAFAKLDVSARTDHGIIYLNTALLKEDGSLDEDDHYLVHELSHFLQQTTGTKPTKSSENEFYLDNKDEIEGFQNQTEYIAETHGDEEAEEYVEKLLDHHEVDDKAEREKRKEKLLELCDGVE